MTATPCSIPRDPLSVSAAEARRAPPVVLAPHAPPASAPAPVDVDTFCRMINHELAACRRRGACAVAMLLEPAGPAQAHGSALAALVGRRLRSRVRAADLVAQLPSDCFGLLLPDAGDAEARAVAQRLTRSMLDGFSLGSRLVVPPVRLQMAVYWRDGDSGEALMRSMKA